VNMPSMRPGDRMRAIYEFKPVDHLPRAEFYIWPEAIERWKQEGLPEDWQPRNFFGYDEQGSFGTGVSLGWTEPPLLPVFEEKVIEVLGEEEIIQGHCGRWLKVFRGRRHGFMPEYIKHPVTDLRDWEQVVQRLNPDTPERWTGLAASVQENRAKADAVGGLLSQGLIGGYMYLRALIGPVDLLYKVHDDPALVHACMQGWLRLMDAALVRVQAAAELDEVFFAEDICYNHGLLISPDAVREFLFPYYGQLLRNARGRQRRRLYFKLDTDGDCRPAIPLYRELGMDFITPCEVASGCDVVAIGRDYPWLALSGGIDKRVLAQGKDAIDAHLRHILPAMVKRGGYFPTCDHGVPDDVSFENYQHYLRRLREWDH
jgi:hypothetical protein